MKLLSPTHKRNGFIRAVTNSSGAKKRWKLRRGIIMSDMELRIILRYEFGIAGIVMASDDRPFVYYQAPNLKMWMSWDYPIITTQRPLYRNASTVKMAREIYDIKEVDRENLFWLNFDRG